MKLMSLVKRGINIYHERGITELIKASLSFSKKRLPFVGGGGENGYPIKKEDLEELSDAELLAIVQHEAHRIEKAVYNENLEDKSDYYGLKKKRVNNIIDILINRDYPNKHPILSWAGEIIELEEHSPYFVENNKIDPPELDLYQLSRFVNMVAERRSARVWKDDQPEKETLIDIGIKMIEAATWAPHSGNRQSWRFLLITKDDDRESLSVIKEEHTTVAPLLIFVGMDSRLYGDVADSETGIYIDAGAAAMQMILTAHKAGMGTCWNHFGRDLISSRKKNLEAYEEFQRQYDLPDHIEPIAIIAVGLPEYLPPTPPRRDPEEYLLN